ncbi:MAG: hypothetical protein AAF628_04995 [Planctomycetota bacterium]
MGFRLSVVLVAVAAPLGAQTYADLTTVRGRPSAWGQVLQVRAGVLGSLAGEEDPAIGLDDEIGWDGHVYYRQQRFADRQATLDAYAGRDGAYLGVSEGELVGQDTQSRLELTVRYFPFYREGFYRDGDFVPTGRYEGLDYGAQLTFARELSEGLRMEFGPFFRRMTFDRNEDTPVNYVTPDDFSAYGVRAFLEHGTLVLDRVTGRPRDGFVLTLVGEREQNDASRRFGTVGIFETDLPSGLWRGRGHLEWYYQQSSLATWGLRVDGQISDEKDRVYNYDAQKPQGHLWVDGQLGLRLDFGQALAVEPFAQLQFLRIVDEAGLGTDQETFFGGGVNARFDFGDGLSLVGEYSFLENESRPPVSVTDDTFGEHRFFFGLEVRFAGQRN